MTGVERPAQLPDLRTELMGRWQPGGLFWRLIGARVASGNPWDRVDGKGVPRPGLRANGVPTGDPGIYSRWEWRALRDATLWWVSAPMVDLTVAAARAIPDDARIHELAPPSLFGLVVFEEPWTGSDAALADGTVQVDAMVWGPSKLPPIPDREHDSPDGGNYALSISMYRRWPDIGWDPIGRSDWPLVDALGDAPWAMTDTVKASFVEDRRVLAAMFALLQQEGLTSTTIHRDRAATRRAQRVGLSGDQGVRVVTLRRPRPQPGPDGTHRAVEHDHRWLVEGHWRWQAHGEGRKQRKLIWIAPYVKGPADAPLRVKDTVRAWRR